MGTISANQKVPKKGKEFKCYACKNIFPLEEKSETESKGKYNYCLSCGRKKFNERKKTKDIAKVPFGTEVFKDNNDLYVGDEDTVKFEKVREIVDYILDLFKLEANAYYAYLTLQINHLIKNYNCTCKGIYLTLKYFYILLDNPIPEEPHIISVVATNYGKALHSWKLQRDLEKNADDLVSDKVPVVNVYVARSAQKQYNNYYDNKWRSYENMISIDDIEITEENDGV